MALAPASGRVRPRRLVGLVLVLAVACLGAAPADAAAANLLTNPSFEATGTAWLAPWTFASKTGAAGTISQATLPDATHAARVDVTQQSSSSPWLVQLQQTKLALTAGQSYKVSFAAKASSARQIGLQLQLTPSPYTSYLTRNFDVTTSWATYSVTYAASATASDVSLRLHLASSVGSVWIDKVAVEPSAPTTPLATTKGFALAPFAEYWGSNLNGMKSDFADISAAKVGWARIELRYTPTPNPAFDAAVQEAKARGIQLLAVVYKPAPLNDLGTDTQRATFRSWLAQMVTRHKHWIRRWEIHNEPNLHYEWNIDDSATSDQTKYAASVRRYVTHLRDGYETVKANDAGSTVVFGGPSEWTVERYMNVLVTTDAYRYFNVMSFHPYGSTPDRVVSRFTSFLWKMRGNANYANKPIWVTEMGFNTTLPNRAGYVTSEQQKADYLVSAAKKLYAAGATLPLFVYTLHSNSTAGAAFGVTVKDKATLKTTYLPAFYAFRDLVF